MNNSNVNNERIQINLGNVKSVADGQYSRLLCAKCKQHACETYFTANSDRSRFGIWFECTSCGNVEHISCSADPEGFSESRISFAFQANDQRAWDAEKA